MTNGGREKLLCGNEKLTTKKRTMETRLSRTEKERNEGNERRHAGLADIRPC